jgi:hypothetical protein
LCPACSRLQGIQKNHRHNSRRHSRRDDDAYSHSLQLAAAAAILRQGYRAHGDWIKQHPALRLDGSARMAIFYKLKTKGDAMAVVPGAYGFLLPCAGLILL